ncbi:sugar-binding transcriptional regulator [Lactobacillus corticis]|uniref:Citrate lyase regulator n=1 Tax=Lactobacillus corticis TaxID=2201249 RepID=A0A916VIL0_9LACO|nr:sugar-binding transcriptional regulator [Lactobacillus corticis]GFZ27418.1 citrate lyase regulator [Lactobacillus corticis]
MASNNMVERLTKVAELYYNHGLTQQEIASTIHIHRSEISRMLKQARKLGIVQIKVNSNIKLDGSLQNFLIDNFGLKDALVVPEPTDTNPFQNIGNYASNYLVQNISNNSVVGLSWGHTLADTIHAIPETTDKKGITVVSLIGGPVGRLKNDYQSSKLVYSLSRKFNAKSEAIAAPALVGSKELKHELISNPNNELIFNYWTQLDYAVLGIGSSLITELSQWQEFYKNSKFIDAFKDKSIVGDMLSRPFSIDGKLISSDKFNIIGMDLPDLKKVPNVIAVAFGQNKAEAILGALKTGVLDVLITTDTTAMRIKSIYEHKSQL